MHWSKDLMLDYQEDAQPQRTHENKEKRGGEKNTIKVQGNI
jgi:hypothetical protein